MPSALSHFFLPRVVRALGGQLRRDGFLAAWRAAIAVFRDFGWSGVRQRVHRSVEAGEREAEYAAWAREHRITDSDREHLTADIAGWRRLPLISVITPVYNTDPQWLHACVESVRAQIYQRWELLLCDDGSSREETLAALRTFEADPRIRVTYLRERQHIVGATNTALAGARGEFVAFLDHDDELSPDALAEVVRAIQAHPDVDVVYSDEDKLHADGQHGEAFFKPQWSPMYLRSCMYVGHLLVIRRSEVDAAGHCRAKYPGAQDYDLVLRVTERTSRVQHIPRVLYHWRKVPGSSAHVGAAKPWAGLAARAALADHGKRIGVDAVIEAGPGYGFYRWRQHGQHGQRRPPVSIVVTGTDARGSAALSAATIYPTAEWMPVATRPDEAQAAGWAAAVNQAVKGSGGEYVAIVDGGIMPASSDWLTQMLAYFEHPHVGVVCPRIDYADGRVFSVGMVLGVGPGWAPALEGDVAGTHGYFGNAVVCRDCSAAGSACLVLTRELFELLGGFALTCGAEGSAVGFCLAARDLGRSVVCAAEVRCQWRGQPPAHVLTVDPADVTCVRERWPEAFDDPFFNPNFDRTRADFRLSRRPSDGRRG